MLSETYGLWQKSSDLSMVIGLLVVIMGGKVPKIAWICSSCASSLSWTMSKSTKRSVELGRAVAILEM